MRHIETHCGNQTIVDTLLDEMRESHALCYSCEVREDCQVLADFLSICRDNAENHGLAFAVSRCPHFKFSMR